MLLGVRRSAFGVRRSAFGVRRSFPFVRVGEDYFFSHFFFPLLFLLARRDARRWLTD